MYKMKQKALGNEKEIIVSKNHNLDLPEKSKNLLLKFDHEREIFHFEV